MPQDYVLIAEPTVSLARTFELIVRDAQLEAVTVRSGLQARSTLLKWGIPRLLITNLVLPMLDGFALLGEVRKSAPASEVPAVVVSSSAELRKTAFTLRLELGITELASPTMSADSLREIVTRALTSATYDPSLSMIPDVTTLRPPPAIPLAHTLDPVRLARIEAMALVDDGPPDAVLQALVDETAKSLNVPIALVSLVLAQRQWFKAHIGLSGKLLEERGMRIEQSFCRHVVDDELATPLIVPDATKHPLFANNELVKRGTVGGYAGAPLRTPDGLVLGTLCIIDNKPLSIGQDQIDHLIALARRVAGELELRVSKPPPADGGASELPYLEAVLNHLEVGFVLTDAQRKITFVNRTMSDLLGMSAQELVGWPQKKFSQRLAALSDVPDEITRRMRVQADGPVVAYEELALARPQRRVLRWVEKPVRLPNGLAQLGVYTDVSAEVALRAMHAAALPVGEEYEL
jgi:PAS domain S-box-containing protein